MSANEEVDGQSSRGSESSSNQAEATESRRPRGRRAKSQKSAPTFRCTFHLTEDDTGVPLYGCAFNPYFTLDNLIFATVGGSRVTVYRCMDDGKFRALYTFTDPDDDDFYTCTWLYDPQMRSHLLAFGGRDGTIKLIPFGGRAAMNSLVGHGQAINDLATHPTDSTLLLSASKDQELRLWNVRAGVCVAIFGGDGGHKSEVLSCDFDLLGERIVSGGMDHCVKVWSLLENHQVDKAIQQSRGFMRPLNLDKNFPTVKVTNAEFSTTDLHKNYVDCVKWFGYTLLSKSCENAICHWKPGSNKHLEISKGETNVSLFTDVALPNCELWFMKFAVDRKLQTLAAGNQQGKIYVWDLNALSASPITLSHRSCTSTIRQIAFSADGETLIAICDDSTVWRWMKKKSQANQ